MFGSNTYLQINLDIIAENFREIQKKAGVPVMAVVKADAYGHGAVQIARLLEKDCSFFGVSSLSEALELIQADIKKPILILGYTPAEAFPVVVKKGIRPTIFSYQDAVALSEEAVRQGITVPFHFAVDTGMHRLGFAPSEESADICAKIAALPGLYAEGLFSHFATADTEDLTRTHKQAALFDTFDQMLKKRDVQVPIRHLDNSAGIINFAPKYEMVRAGIVIYGHYPSDKVAVSSLSVKPALSWHSCVSYVKTLPAGKEISYGGTFTTTRQTVVATVPVGYADGYRRNLSSRYYVLIRGCRAPILGRICMDQMMVDVTDIPGVQAGDTVTLLGTDGSETITTEALAQAMDSFNYELICTFSRRTPRFYYQNGKLINQVNYLLD